MAMDTQTDLRQQRGIAIFRSYADKIRQVIEGKYLVPSQTRSAGTYFVDVAASVCSCPDQQETRRRCKHLWAVLVLRHEVDVPGVEDTSVVAEKKPKGPPRNWKAINASSAEEKARVQVLLRGLCDCVQQPAYKGNGRPALSLGDVIYGATMAVFNGDSIRRSGSDLTDCQAKGLLEDKPSAGSLFRYLEKPELMPLIQMMIRESAAPLIACETEAQYAADGTGFATGVYGSYCDYRHGGKERKVATFVKAHVIAGTRTHAVTWVQPTDGHVNDTTMLPTLVQETARRYAMKEVSADAGYLSKANAMAIADVGAVPYISFKDNTTGKTGPEAWLKMWHDFNANTEDYLTHYHRRSNVETVFHMVKTKFGERIRSRTRTAMFNETLLKFLSHNLSCMVRAIHELGIEPKFDRVFGLNLAVAS